MNKRNLSDRLKKHFGLDDSLKHFDESREHILERFILPETISVQDLHSAILAIYKSNGFALPAGSDYARRASNGLFMFQGGNTRQHLHSVTVTPVKNMPISITVADLKKTEKNIKAGL